MLFLLPIAAQSIELAPHELATNATKHGALSVPPGRVSISWQILRDQQQGQLRMTWQESGGPIAVEPEHKGFGHIVFDRMIKQYLHATVELRYGGEGPAWILLAPLGAVTGSFAH